MGRKRLSIFTRVRKRLESECWDWLLSVNKSTGYGQVSDGFGKTTTAHRRAWIEVYGPIPEGLNILHSCDNRRCCNPDHLFDGTNQDNQTDKVRKGRQARGEKQGASKFTNEQAEWVRKVYQPGHFEFGATALSKRFMVSVSQIFRILNRETYTSVH